MDIRALILLIYPFESLKYVDAEINIEMCAYLKPHFSNRFSILF